jgi:excisionase family DNA binding protein
MDSRLMTKRTVAARLGISMRSVDYWRAKHGMPAVKIDRTVRFDADEVRVWLQSHRRNQTST